MQYDIGQALRTGNRAANQDRAACIVLGDGVLLVLADGLGGRAHGELAAQALVDVAGEMFRNAGRPLDPHRLLVETIRAAHFVIRDKANELPKSPGTTGVLCWVRDGLAHWAHVGDSRLYLLREGRVLQRTRDHSYVEHLYQRGAIRRQDMGSHPARNQLTQCIGCTERVPEISVAKPVVLRPNDVVLLCSDGLWSGIGEAEIAARARFGPMDELAQRLAEDAETNTAPHSDNVAVLAMRYVAARGSSRPVRLASDARRRGDDQLADAVEDIERVLRQYMDEMGGKK